MMRMSMRSVVTGAVAILAAGALTPALARDDQMHILTVQLPGGGVEQIQYLGDVAPRVIFAPRAPSIAVPTMAIDSFAVLEQISALMDRQAEAMLRQVEALSNGFVPALPPGANGHSFVSTMPGSGVCTQSVQITYNGRDPAPRIVSNTSGDCGPDPRRHVPANVNMRPPSARPNAAPRAIEVRATGQTPERAPVRQVAWAR
jgi:hypothetical protein